jgi:hypothetical protein
MRSPTVLIGIFLVAAAGTTALVFGQPKTVPKQPPQARPGTTTNPQLIERGRSPTVVGDCMACHTAENGERFAGGRPLKNALRHGAVGQHDARRRNRDR